MSKKKKTYTAAPEVPGEVAERYAVMLEVLSGKLTVSEGARRLNLSRNHFQTLMHRGLGGLIEGLSQRPTGRPSKSEKERQLAEENERLQKELARLKEQAETTDKLLGMASEFLKGRIRPLPRGKRTKKTKPMSGSTETDDTEPARQSRVAGFRSLQRAGVPLRTSCKLLGPSEATLRRWESRSGAPDPRGSHDDPRGSIPAELAHEVERRVRETNGLIGAEALRHAVPGVTRRQAAAVKRRTLTSMERERKAECQRITVTMPGVLRGFDAMELPKAYVLAAADGCIPYRTVMTHVGRYTAENVAKTLALDLAENGVPLVYRLDRASSHRTEIVTEILQDAGALVLHGPPRYPKYFAQLERQNRDHRAWWDALRDGEDPEEACERLRNAMNRTWPRATLGWKTPEELWRDRPVIQVDRDALREEVQDRAARIRRERAVHGRPVDQAERFAIEEALINRGYLRREIRGWC